MKVCFSLGVALVVTFLGTSHANETDDISEGVGRYLKTVLENLKQHMDTGIDDLHIPPLDPLKIEDKIDEHINNAGTVKVEDLKIFGLKTLDIQDIKVNLNDLFADAHITIGNIRAEGKYNADLLLAKIFPIRGHGNLLIELNDLKLRADLNLKSEDFSTFEVTRINYSLIVGGSKINFENIIDPKLAPTINKILSGVTPIIANNVLPKMNSKLTPKIIQFINRELSKVDFHKLIPHGKK